MMNYSNLSSDQLIQLLQQQRQQINQQKQQMEELRQQNQQLETQISSIHHKEEIKPIKKQSSNIYNKSYRGYKNVVKDVYYTGDSKNLQFVEDCGMFLFMEDDLRTQYNKSKETYNQLLKSYNVSSIPCFHYMYFYVKVGNQHIGSKWLPMGDDFDETKERICELFYNFCKKFNQDDGPYNIEQDLNTLHIYSVYRLVYFTPYETISETISLLTETIRNIIQKTSKREIVSESESLENEEEDNQNIFIDEQPTLSRKERYEKEQKLLENEN